MFDYHGPNLQNLGPLVKADEVKLMVPYKWVHVNTPFGCFQVFADRPSLDITFGNLYNFVGEIKSEDDEFMFLTMPEFVPDSQRFVSKIIHVNRQCLGWVTWMKDIASFYEIVD